MLKNQKSIRGGIEDFLCPFTDMYITQGSGGSYSHKGTMANDIRGTQAGIKYPYYAPCTVKCIKTYSDSGQVMWQSVNKVRFANGRIDYATFMTAHDDTMDAKIGQVVNQGSKLGNMGKKGNATGVHCHIEISQSNDTTWKKNKYGVYCFNNEYDTDACYFMDGTNILNGMGGSWKYLKDVPVDEPKKEEPKPVVDKEKEQLKKQVSELQEQIIVLENRILEVTTERDNLKAAQPTKIFTCTKTADYQIKLYENEQLFIK
jgi:hypothetical protein